MPISEVNQYFIWTKYLFYDFILIKQLLWEINSKSDFKILRTLRVLYLLFINKDKIK
jgi:hypothetical protein